jgi:glycerol-3-phosphate dehydrogenase (NAD(P)+)
MAKVCVVGAGSWGTAMAVMLANNGHTVSMWARDQKKAQEMNEGRENQRLLPGAMFPWNLQVGSDISMCQGCDVTIMAVPSVAVRSVAQQMAPYIQPGQIVVNIAKGLELSTLKRLSTVIMEELPQAKVAIMSGPSHAEEVAKGLPTTNVVACSDENTARYVQDIVMNPMFRVYTNDDMIGVEMGAALKNVIAICAGACDGMKLGDNTKAALMTRGIHEIARLGIAMGAKVETFGGLSGIGDLIVTCTSMHSRNRRAGILIGQGKSVEEALKEVNMVVEGYVTAKAAYDLAQKMRVEMPIVTEAYRVLYEGKDPKTAIMDLMTRDKKTEC